MATNKNIFDFSEAARTLGEGLIKAARRPDVYGYQPHEKQEIFHRSEARGRLYIGGNRSGKSTGGIVEDLWWATGRHPYRKVPEPPTRGRIISVDFVNGIEKIILPELARWLPPSDLIEGSWTRSYSKSNHILTLANGSTIDLMSGDQDLDKFAGTSRHWIHYDEEPPQAIFIENRTRLIDTAGSWWMTMTPVEGMSWIYDEIYLPGLEPGGYIQVIQVDITENPHVNTAEIEMFLSGLSEDEQRSRGKGEFVQLGGLIYKAFNPDLHVIDPCRPPTGWQLYTTMDHGLNNPTAWLWVAISPDGDVLIFDEHYEAGKIVEYHAGKVKEKEGSYGVAPYLRVGDPAIRQRNPVTGDSVQIEYGKHGIHIVEANNEVSQGINKVQTYFLQNKVKITRNCENLLWELPRYRWKTWASKKLQTQNNPHEIPHKKDDHACDALRYLMTFMPDLAPVPAIQRQTPMPKLGSQGTPPSGAIVDKNLSKSRTFDNEYTIVDEHIGGIY